MDRNGSTSNSEHQSQVHHDAADEKQESENVDESPISSAQPRKPDYTTIGAAIRRRMEKFSWDHVRALFATKKLAWSTSLLIIIWG